MVSDLPTVLKSLRKKRGLSIHKAANEIGIVPETLRRYECDERKPTSDVILILADYYGVSTDYLLGRTGSKSTNINIRNAVDITGLIDEAIIALLDLKLICKQKNRAYIDLMSCLLEGTQLEYLFGLLEGYITDGDETISSSLSMSHVDIKVKDIALSAITNTIKNILDNKSDVFLNRYKTTQQRLENHYNDLYEKKYGKKYEEGEK